MTAAAREFTAQYGNITIDEAAGASLIEKDGETHRLRIGYTAGEFSCVFRVRLIAPTGVKATDDAQFNTYCSALEVGLRKPRQNFLFKLNGTTRVNWQYGTLGTLTAFNIVTSLEKIADDTSTARTRDYRFTVSAKLIADLAGQAFRSDSNTAIGLGLNKRRVHVLFGSWTTSAGVTARAQYTAAGDTYFNSRLEANVAGGQWVQVDEDPKYDEENAELAVTRTYYEVVGGNIGFSVKAGIGANQAKTLQISGDYCATTTPDVTAKANHDANVGTLCSNILQAYGLLVVDANPIAKEEGWTQNLPMVGNAFGGNTGPYQGTYSFSRTYEEIVYPQGPGGNDDVNIGTFTLAVRMTSEYYPVTRVGEINVQRVVMVEANYSAEIDKNSAGGLDPNVLWLTKFRQHCLTAMQTKLAASQLVVLNEFVEPVLTKNWLNARIVGQVRGSGVLEFSIYENIDIGGAFNLNPRADGEPLSFFPFKRTVEHVLTRGGTAKYVVGTEPPQFFTPGAQASGFDVVDTGVDALEQLSQQALGLLPEVPGWWCRYATERHVPVSRGDVDYSTMEVTRVEVWDYVKSIEPVATLGTPG